MFQHDKKLMREVKVEKPNPQYAVLMQEQLGGCNGEVKAAMQYLSQSFRANDPVFKDLFFGYWDRRIKPYGNGCGNH